MNPKAITAAMRDLCRIAPKRETIPVLSCVRITRQDGIATLQATDMERVLTITLTWPGADLDALYHAPTLLKLLRAGTTPDAALASLTTACPVEDWPTPVVKLENPCTPIILDPVPQFTRVAKAMSTEQTRYYLNGIYWHAHNGTLRAVTTDGHRLHLADSDIPAPNDMPAVILPRAAVDDLLAFKRGACLIEIGDLARFTWPGAVYVTKLVDGTFPPYQRVIPGADGQTTRMSRDALSAAIKTVSAIFSGRIGNVIRLSVWDGICIVTAKDLERGEMQATLPASGALERVGFNPAYLFDMLASLTGDAVVYQADPRAPARFEDSADPKFVGVIMPMRI